jgi:hypothetical protein
MRAWFFGGGTRTALLGAVLWAWAVGCTETNPDYVPPPDAGSDASSDSAAVAPADGGEDGVIDGGTEEAPFRCSGPTSCSSTPDRPVCDPESRQCVECVASGDCNSAARPICNPATQACDRCVADMECEARQGSKNPGICLETGTCPTAAEVIVVNNVNGCATSTGPPGSSTAPLCLAQTGIAQLVLPDEPRRIVAMRGSLGAWTLGTAVSGTVLVVGQESAKLSAAGVPYAIQISAGKVVLRDLEVNPASATTGIRVDGGADVTLLRVRVIGGTGAKEGISTSSGALRVNRCLIQNNAGGGLTTSGTLFDITNSIFAGNGLIAVKLGSVPAGAPRFLHNTVVSNVIGVSCEGPHSVRSSILYNNSGGAASGCMLVGCVTDDPKLDASFHLTTESATCIDKADPNESLPDDYDGDPRTSGGAPDVGADELR